MLRFLSLSNMNNRFYDNRKFAAPAQSGQINAVLVIHVMSQRAMNKNNDYRAFPQHHMLARDVRE